MALPRFTHLIERFPWLIAAKESVVNLSRALMITSLLVTGGVIGARYLGMIEASELAAYDHFVQISPNQEPDDRVLVVGITEDDLQTLEEWPLSDQTLAQALAALNAQQPAAIAIDILRDFPHAPGTEELHAQLQRPEAIIVCKMSAANDMGAPPPPEMHPDQVGFADVVVDSGGILRRNLLMAGVYEPETPYPKQHFCNEPGKNLLSLSFRAALLYFQARNIKADFNEAQQLVIGATILPRLDANLGGYQGVDSAGYQIMLKYRSAHNAVDQVSLMELIRGQVDPKRIRDRIVFIGYTTPQAKDEFYTPYSSGKDDQQQMPGVIVHAQAASQLLSIVLDGRPLIWAWPMLTEILWIFVWSTVGGILAWYLRHPAAFAFVILLGCSLIYAICFLIFLQDGWIPLIPPMLTFIGTAVGIVSFDRFNNSAYGQQVYRKVKTFLRLDIDIDEGKVEEQVSEITESDYFRDLQETVRTIRSEPDAVASNSEPPWPHEHLAQSWQTHAPDSDEFAKRLDSLLHPEESTATANGTAEAASQAEAQNEEDYWQSLSQDFQAVKDRLTEEHPPSPQPEQANEQDYWQALSQDFQAVKESLNAPAPEPPDGLLDVVAGEPQNPSASGGQPTQPIAVEDAAADDSEYEAQFLAAIAQEAQLLQQLTESSTPTPSAPGHHAAKSTAAVVIYASFKLEAGDCNYIDDSPSTQDYLDHLTQVLAEIRSKL